jgi:two-component system sensor histidine kinase/response regulator
MSTATQSTILIADDNPTNLNVLFEYLSAQGYRVLIAEDGTGAIEQAHYGLPDLILLDVMMPGLDGFETCQKLKESSETRDIPVIFMTAISETAYILKAFSVGGVDYITKPLQREEVNARVRNHISIRRLQRELQTEIAVRHQAEEELRVINAGKDVFFSVLAHDLKNPMGGLLGLSEALVEMIPLNSETELRETVLDIRNTSRQIGDLLFDLLSWAQMQMGKLEPAPEPVSIQQEIEFAVGLVGLAAENKNIEIVNEIAESFKIYCDVRMNDTVLRNLLSNAVKFSPTGGKIRIGAEKKEGDLEITIADSGKGIAADQLDALFRLGENKTTFGTAGEKGTGLGLPLSREMVEKNGGRIWVESTLGQGSVFHFTVPLVKKGPS